MARDLKPGDVVELQSGSPRMTVTTVYPPRDDGAEELCKCMYFAETALREAMVPAAALRRAEEKT